MKRKKIENAEQDIQRPRKTGRILLFILAGCILVSLGVWRYAVNRFSYKPDWYQAAEAEKTVASHKDTTISYPKPQIEQKDEPASKRQPMTLGVESDMPRRINTSSIIEQLAELETRNEATLSEEQVYPLIQETFRQSGFDPDRFLKACKTTFTANHATLELIVDLRQAPHEAFSQSGERAWLTVMQMLPEDALSEVYLKMDLFPFKDKNMVRFLSGSQVAIGKITVPIEKVEKKFGLKMQINLEELAIRDYQLKEKQLVLFKAAPAVQSN